ncbi:hypothetical protein [Duganella levis]|uniref:Uncharacterized protein n=1 Tax=Duganella levis TaxID=2692169 RepID=A0ABW9VVD7_9BURK|nr:hypothetical protein [Duganella levis]MYN25594.1 hypothetical protein [Duganella levis]
MLEAGWQSFRDFIAAYADGLHSLAEIIKIFGAFASFYALLKLRQIERKYLFKATMPGLIEKIDSSLQALNEGLNDPIRHRIQIGTALNHLVADLKTVKRRMKGESRSEVAKFLGFMRPLGFDPHFWQSKRVRQLSKDELSELYNRGRGLLRSLENELGDSAWSNK